MWEGIECLFAVLGCIEIADRKLAYLRIYSIKKHNGST